MVEISVSMAIFIVVLMGATAMFGIISDIKKRNAEAQTDRLIAELKEYGMYEELRRHRYECFEAFNRKCRAEKEANGIIDDVRKILDNE